MSNHELTGEPYLGVTMYGHRFRPRGRFWDRVFEKHVIDDRGREYWESRRWSNWPFWKLYELQYGLRPYLCKIGIHDRADIHEADASIWRGYCTSCKKLTKARKPQPADPAAVVEWEGFNQVGKEIDAALDAYAAGGPCPWCEPPEGERHEFTCWEAE